MGEIIYEARLKARKDHECMACVFIIESGILDECELSFSEFRSVVKAKRDDLKIKKGQYYLSQTVRFEGELRSFKARPDIHDICIKHDLYEV